MNKADAQAIVDSRPWWYHKFEIFPDVITPGVYEPHGTLQLLELPLDLNEKRILEIGPADGFFTKVLAERGAEVTAVDYAARDFHGFAIMEKLAGKRFNFIQSNIYEIVNIGFRPFDIVLCLGVLYHLPDLCRAIWSIRPLVADSLIVETLISLDHNDEPIAEYLPAASVNGDSTNFWAPNLRCCEAILADAGYLVMKTFVHDNRAVLHCRRDPAPGAGNKMELAYSGHSAQRAADTMFESIRTVVSRAEEAAKIGESELALQRMRALCLSDYGDVLLSMPNEAFPALSTILPQMASVETQTNWTGGSGKVLLRNSVLFTRIVEFQFRHLGRRALRDATVLDYGCGYGRLLRTMSYYVNPERLYGVDPWSRSIELCVADRVFGHITKSEYFPTELDVGEARFDLMYSYSVFTHTSLRATIAALKVLRRYIRDDGMLAITIRPIEYWDRIDELSADQRTEMKRLHRTKGFAFLPHGTNPVDGDIPYGDTSIDPAWLSETFPEWELRAYDRDLDDLQTILFFTPR